MIDRLDVHIELGGRTQHAGTAYFNQRRSGPVGTTFAYAPEYLAIPKAIAVDPNMPLVSGQQATEGMPGAFQDCAPDRWGRNLIVKRSRVDAADRRTATLNDVDFLAGVSDLTRQGALRFTLPGDTSFIDTEAHVPKLIALPRLLRAVDQLADDEENEEAIKALLDAGSGSLGGARPKASVIDDGRLLLAKFPHRNDEWDIMAWEKTALDIADQAGIEVPARRLVGFDGRQVLLLERFDRTDEHRIPYISAMTLVGGRSGQDHDYADIASGIPDVGSRVAADLNQLFRRAVLNCAIHNTDDHLRNHGFLGDVAGWRLSPVFDINPNPDLNEGRVTSIGAASRADDEPAGLMALADACRLSDEQARTVIAEVLSVVEMWAEIATSNGVTAREQRRFQSMFDDRVSNLIAVSSATPNRRGGPSGVATASAQGRIPKGTRTAGRFTHKAGNPPTTNPQR